MWLNRKISSKIENSGQPKSYARFQSFRKWYTDAPWNGKLIANQERVSHVTVWQDAILATMASLTRINFPRLQSRRSLQSKSLKRLALGVLTKGLHSHLLVTVYLGEYSQENVHRIAEPVSCSLDGLAVCNCDMLTDRVAGLLSWSLWIVLQ